MSDKLWRYKQNRLQQLRGFCYAARLKSISKAASKMLLSQPSVSLQIQALEREFKVQLFSRRGPHIKLTYDGQRLLDLAAPLVESIEGLEQSFSVARQSPARGTVNIAAGGSTLQYLMPQFVAKFSHDFPLVDIRLHNLTGKVGLELLRADEVDFAVGPMLETPSDITFHPLVTYEPVLITKRNHPLATRRRVTLKDVVKYPLILPPKHLSTHRIVEAVLSNRGLNYDVKLEVGGYDVIKKYVALGLGISIVMSHCLSRSDRLHAVPMGQYFPRRTYGIVLYKGRRLSPAAEMFVHTIRSNVKPGELSEGAGGSKPLRKIANSVN